jgi:hypothetical protein
VSRQQYVTLLGLVLLLAFLGGFSAVLIMGSMVNAQEEILRVRAVEAQELKIVNRTGAPSLIIKQGGVLFKEGDRTTGIVTSKLISLVTSPGSSETIVITPTGLTLGRQGKWRAALTTDPDPALIVTDAVGRERIRLSVKNEGPSLAVRNQHGQMRLLVGSEDESDNVIMGIYDKNSEHVLAGISSVHNQGGFLVANPQGKVLWSVP